MPDPIDALRKLLGLDRPRQGRDFYDRAEEGRRMPAAELAVVEAAFDGGGPLADVAIEQLRHAATVYRDRPDDGTYELRIASGEDRWVRGVPHAGWATDWMELSAIDPPRELRLRITIGSPGFVGLLGQTADGQRWPREWRIADASLAGVRARAPWIRFPTPTEIAAERARVVDALLGWLGDASIVHAGRPVFGSSPASADAITAFEAAQRFTLPETYRALVSVTDGVEIGDDLHILGTHDAYRFDVPGPPRLIITAPNEDGATVLAEDGTVLWMDLDDTKHAGRAVAPDLRTWLRDRLQPT